MLIKIILLYSAILAINVWIPSSERLTVQYPTTQVKIKAPKIFPIKHNISNLITFEILAVR